MSSSSGPISPEAFALAIADLPLSNVYAKVSEIRNSIAHLQHSNTQLKSEAEAGDQDCAEAMQENVQVMDRMKERLQLLRTEVERRGSMWHEEKPFNGINGDASGVTMNANGDAAGRDSHERMMDVEQRSGNARLDTEHDDEDANNGLHL